MMFETLALVALTKGGEAVIGCCYWTSKAF